MKYTVKEVEILTGVTVKALHHYHKIGLLVPCEISDAGYRFYGENELERLQQILFYRELDFSLKDIKKAMDNEPNRLECLTHQKELLLARKDRIDKLLKTLENSITTTRKGEVMNKSEMFQSLNKNEWENALSEQKEYLECKYGYNILENQDIDVQDLNKKAEESQQFMKSISESLTNGLKVTDEKLQKILEDHISFLNNNSIYTDAKAFAAQAKFFLEDDFHRNMLESQHIGLCYYLFTAAQAYSELNHK